MNLNKPTPTLRGLNSIYEDIKKHSDKNINHGDNILKCYSYYCRAIDVYHSCGLCTDLERDLFKLKAICDREYLFEQFVALRNELKTVKGYPLGMIGNEQLLELLLSDEYSWDELEMLNEDFLQEALADVNTVEEGEE